MANRDQIFKRVRNSLLDMQASTSQNFEHHFGAFARLLADPSLQSINQKLSESLDVERFLDESLKTQGSMTGSARLVWPTDFGQSLGMKWLLVQKLANEPHHLINFAHTFFTVGRNLTGELQSLYRQFIIPFERDYREFVFETDSKESIASDGKIGTREAQRVVQHITYNISGTNARVNNHSNDHSINAGNFNNSAIEKIQELRDEIQKLALSADEKTEALDLVNEVERQVISGKAKKGVLSALFASLPAVQSIATISKSLYDILRTNGNI